MFASLVTGVLPAMGYVEMVPAGLSSTARVHPIDVMLWALRTSADILLCLSNLKLTSIHILVCPQDR